MKTPTAVEHLRHVALTGWPRTYKDRETPVLLIEDDVRAAPVGTVLHDGWPDKGLGVWVRVVRGVVCVHTTWTPDLAGAHVLADDHLPSNLYVAGAVPGTPAAQVMTDFVAEHGLAEGHVRSPGYRPSTALLRMYPYEDDGEQD